MLFRSNVQNPIGLNEGDAEIVNVTMLGSAGVKGQIVYFDLIAGTSGTTASTKFGSAANPSANVVLATATHNGVGTSRWILGVLMEDIAQNAKGKVCIRGVVQVLGGDTTAVGLGVAPDATSRMALTITKGLVTGIMLETNAAQTATAGSGTVGKWILFDGVNGFGVYIA